MATHAARAARNHEVRQRLDAALERIGKRLNIEIPPEPRRMKDPGLQPVAELERFADFAERVEAALAGLAQEEAPPAGYAALSMDMLREEVRVRELAMPPRASKADLVALLEEDDANPKPPPALDNEDDA